MKFSVLVPTLGLREIELERLLKSLDCQTFKDFEVVVVTQINHDAIKKLVSECKNLQIKHICLDRKGLSYARNKGLEHCSGEWVLLSDDDAWYPADGLEKLNKYTQIGDYNVILTQIYDPIKDMPYKSYKTNSFEIKNKFQLMSKSSIEIAFKRESANKNFDENFGVGAKFPCGEEIDFLIKNFSKHKYLYVPEISVYHLKKVGNDSEMQQYAKGAIYAKHYGRFTAKLILLRDKLKGRNTDKKIFWKGFNEFKSIAKGN